MAAPQVPESVRHHFDPLYSVRVAALTKQDGSAIGMGGRKPKVSARRIAEYRFAGFTRCTLEGMARNAAGQLGRVAVEYDL